MFKKQRREFYQLFASASEKGRKAVTSYIPHFLFPFVVSNLWYNILESTAEPICFFKSTIIQMDSQSLSNFHYSGIEPDHIIEPYTYKPVAQHNSSGPNNSNSSSES